VTPRRREPSGREPSARDPAAPASAASEPAVSAPEAEHCQTCGDLAAPMVVLSADGAAGLAVCVDSEHRRRTVETALLGEVQPGQTLLVHAGTALALESR
jgi:hypothetical protein